MAFNYAATIQALLARANHPLTPPEEAEASRKKAEEWMNKYRTQVEESLAEDPHSIEPEMLPITLKVLGWELIHHLPNIVAACAQHAEVRVRTSWEWVRPSGRAVNVVAVGYPGDLRYFELLWTNAHLMFSTKITPHWDPARPVDENVFLMRQAGIKRREIADAAGWDGENPASRSRVQRVYLKAARDRGENANATGLGFDSKGYREAYAESFVSTLRVEMRRAREAANNGAPAIHGREKVVAEAFYTHCPDMRPSTEVDTPYVDPREDCDACKRSKSGYCSEHRYLKPRAWTDADEARWQRQQNSPSRAAGRESGRDAARGVVVARGTEGTKRRTPVERANGALEG